jgi:hypothetical protein
MLEAEAKRFGVALDAGDVLLRRAEGGPELHVVPAAEELLVHLMAGDSPLAAGSGLLVLARVGAQTLMTRVETDTLAGIPTASVQPTERRSSSSAVRVPRDVFLACDRRRGEPRRVERHEPVRAAQHRMPRRVERRPCRSMAVAGQ